jgi:hypothetical protein
MAKFVPVSVSIIDEGRFIESANLELMGLQQKAVAYVKKHGDKAKGAKSKLTLEVSLECENPEDGSFRIKTGMKTTLPSPPAKVTIGMADKTQDGKDALFVRNVGSGKDHPRQGILATEDGKNVDMETGEVLTPAAPETV